MPDEYISSIPEDAAEVVTSRNLNGEKWFADYFVNGEKIGFRTFFVSGEIESELPLNGTAYWWLAPGVLGAVQPYSNGKMHGVAKQWNWKGDLLGAFTMEHGTGWHCTWGEDNEAVYLSRTHYMKDGYATGFEWLINVDQDGVWEERHWFQTKLHGIEREWIMFTIELKPDYPKFYIYGTEVPQNQYIKATETDPTLPKFNEKDNEPYRDFPDEVKANFR